jgi:hypothetical protein
LFLFLGVEVLSIRKAARLVSGTGADRKSLDRRMYLAVSFLEAAMIVQHSDRPSEYRLVIDRSLIVEEAMRMRQAHILQMGSAFLESLLSRYDTPFMTQLYARRQAELERILR